MAITKSSPKRYVPGKRKGAKMVSRSRWAKRGMYKSSNLVPRVPLREKEQASCVCTELYTYAGSGLMDMNTVYSHYSIQLGEYGRATTIGKAYQEFRITKVTFRFKPSFDAYVPGTGISKPNLYYIIDKPQSCGNLVSATNFRDLGCQPIQLDEGNVDISFVPAVLEAVMYTPTAVGAVASTRPCISPWLSTNAGPQAQPWVPSGIDHGGLKWICEAVAGGGNQYQVEVQAEFEFRKPLTTNA